MVAYSPDQTGPHRSTAAFLLQEVAHELLLWPSQSRCHFHWTKTGRTWEREYLLPKQVVVVGPLKCRVPLEDMYPCSVGPGSSSGIENRHRRWWGGCPVLHRRDEKQSGTVAHRAHSVMLAIEMGFSVARALVFFVVPHLS